MGPRAFAARRMKREEDEQIEREMLQKGRVALKRGEERGKERLALAVALPGKKVENRYRRRRIFPTRCAAMLTRLVFPLLPPRSQFYIGVSLRRAYVSGTCLHVTAEGTDRARRFPMPDGIEKLAMMVARDALAFPPRIPGDSSLYEPIRREREDRKHGSAAFSNKIIDVASGRRESPLGGFRPQHATEAFLKLDINFAVKN